MRRMKFIVMTIFLAAMLLGLMSGAAMADYSSKVDSFIENTLWRDNEYWDQYQHPKTDGNEKVWGCAAYAYDFACQVWGFAYGGGDFFEGASSIQDGDVVQLNDGYDSEGEPINSHFYVVIHRYPDGKLYTAEGNFDDHVRITRDVYTVSDPFGENTPHRSRVVGWHNPYYEEYKDYKSLGSFDGFLIVQDPWKHLVMNKDTNNVELEPDQAARGTAQGCWHFEEQSDGSYVITSLYNGKVLEAASSSFTDGTNVRVGAKQGSGTNLQRWYMMGGSTIAPKADEGRRLDVSGGVFANRTNIQIWSANGTSSQKIWPYGLKNDTDEPFPTGLILDDTEISLMVNEQKSIAYHFIPQNSHYRVVFVTAKLG